MVVRPPAILPAVGCPPRISAPTALARFSIRADLRIALAPLESPAPATDARLMNYVSPNTTVPPFSTANQRPPPPPVGPKPEVVSIRHT